MQQRRLRLGDILDDYCPRERRITNHAVVAMIDDEVKQTRCTTCDADHEYKRARVPPPRRKKDSPAENIPEEIVSTEPLTEEMPMEAEAAPLVEEVAQQAEEAPTAADNEIEESAAEDEGPVHRRLIRATLPRPEGQSPERKLPEFTRPGGRGREFNGNRSGGGGQRHGRGRRTARGAQGSFGGSSFGGSSRFGTPRPNSPHGGQRQNGNRPGPGGGGQRGGRPQGQSRGPGRKRGR